MNRGNGWFDQPHGATRGRKPEKQKKMSPDRTIVSLSAFRAMRSSRWIFAAAVLAATAAPDTADAARRYRVGPGAYDGTWNVMFTPRAGNCSATYSAPFAVSGGRVFSAGGGKVSGGIGRNGSVAVRITVGASAASGNGRLVGNYGGGRWAGIIQGDRCSGVWQAVRG
jgi:hypothetical protein